MAEAPLSSDARIRLDLLFHPADRAEAEDILVTKCGTNLPFLDKLTSKELDRFRFAALKLSEGNLTALRSAIELANSDWRDLLMAAGFGENVTEHECWLPNHGSTEPKKAL